MFRATNRRHEARSSAQPETCHEILNKIVTIGYHGNVTGDWYDPLQIAGGSPSSLDADVFSADADTELHLNTS